MLRAILVLNAGSSSLKFALHARQANGSLAMQLDGQIADLYGTPRFEAKDASGAALKEGLPALGTASGVRRRRTLRVQSTPPHPMRPPSLVFASNSKREAPGCLDGATQNRFVDPRGRWRD